MGTGPYSVTEGDVSMVVVVVVGRGGMMGLYHLPIVWLSVLCPVAVTYLPNYIYFEPHYRIINSHKRRKQSVGQEKKREELLLSTVNDLGL